MLFDYHMHTPLCGHAVGHPREYAKEALRKGLAEIGFSEHNPMPEKFDDWRMNLGDFPEYLKLLTEARTTYPTLPIRLGLECDFIPGRESWIRELAKKAEFDYLIGAVHYIAPDWDVDNPLKLDRWKQQPVEEVWTRYFRALSQAAQSGLFDFLAHPDLVKKFGHIPQGDLLPYYREALEAIATSGMAIEVSTAGLRKEVGEIYPSAQFLREAFRRNIPILISSDSHAPGEVGHEFSRALALVKEVGYRELTSFQKRRPIKIPIS
ncbi:MAG: histidinol-phosphatase HisJ family protein [Verrucomicrobia bacterium]|nr:histidinol-phosphatase HisJ family protein [Verrucomicrobiota bacterium]